MFADGQELDVREAHLLHVFDELLRELAVAQPAVAVAAAPRPKVHLVDRHRLVELDVAPGHPFSVLPCVIRRIHDRRVSWWRFVRGGIRIRLERQEPAVTIEHFELVLVAVTDIGNENLPDAVSGMQAHRVPPTIPVIEASNYADAGSIGRPNREARAPDAEVFSEMRPEFLVNQAIGAFTDQIQVHLAQR